MKNTNLFKIVTLICLLIAFSFCKNKTTNPIQTDKNSCDCPPSKYEGGQYYSQYYEDYVLAYVFDTIKSGKYVDVGANDPKENNMTLYFYQKGWNGINVEPNKVLFEKITAARTKDINLNIGISDSSGGMPFYYIEEYGTSTFDINQKLELEKSHGFKFNSINIPLKRLSEVFIKNPMNIIHFMNVDVEGFERKVLLSIDFEKTRPMVFCIEATYPMSEEPSDKLWKDVFQKNGYLFAMSDGLNHYYVDKNKPEFMERFAFINMCVSKSKIQRKVKINGFNNW